MENSNKKLTFYKLLAILMLVLSTILIVFIYFYDNKTISNIEKTGSNGVFDTYCVTYSNGTTSNFTVDSDKVTIDEIYYSLKQNGYTGTYSDFLKEYLRYETNETNKTTNINKALLSGVSIYSEFEIIKQEPIYTQTPFGPMITDYKDVKDTSIGAGSGIIYSLDIENGNAYLITNYHVVYNKDAQNVNKIGKINIFLYGSEVELNYVVDKNGNSVLNENGYPKIAYGEDAIECEYVGGSLNYDIAVLKITNSNILKSSNAKAVKLADSYSVGSTAIAIGNPEAQGISVTEGIVSVESEYMQMYGADETTVVTFRTLRIDTAINSGNSGGGLFNENGELIGIVNAKVVAEEIENIAYAIPKDIAIGVSDNIIYNYETNNSNKVNKVMLGLTLSYENSKAVWDESTQTTKIVEDVVVEAVETNSFADILNFEVGDKIKSIKIGESEPLIPTRMYQVIDFSLTFRVGDTIVYKIDRNGENTTITLVVTSEMFVEID